MNKPAKYLSLSVLVIVLFASIRILYSWWFYIDESITEGSGYGFSIGSSKSEIIYDIEKLQEQNSDAFMSLYENSKNQFINISIGEFVSEPKLRENFSRWEVVLDERSVSNSITLHFEGDSLFKIYRHRKDFELP